MISRTVKVALAATAAAAAGAAYSQTVGGAPGTAVGAAPGVVMKRSHDVYYNVCRGTDPSCLAQNNGWAPMSASSRTRVLIYSRTAGPRHANLGTAAPLDAGLNPPMQPNNVMQATLRAWLAEEGITADWTEDPGSFSPNNYGAVILASGNRDNLIDLTQTSPTTPMTNLRQYMRRGGGVVAIHNAFGANYNWPYYEGLLGNANFYDHGPNRAGSVNTLAVDPATAGLPATWDFQDEWYNLTPFPENVKFLATVDTSTLTPLTGSPHPGHAGFHPVAWCQYFDGGRVFATTLGHNTTSFTGTGPGAAEFKKFIVQGIKSAMGLTEFCTAQ
jgi:type 1 glutamine amidotransferase